MNRALWDLLLQVVSTTYGPDFEIVPYDEGDER